jgi:predicted phosphodiesterase
LFALDAVLTALAGQNIGRIICLGDVAAFGPQPREVLARLQEIGCPIVMGNTDEWLLDPKPHPVRDEDSHRVTGIEMWAAEQLTPADKAFIRTFQPTVQQDLSEIISLLCFHGSPRSNTEILKATTPDEEVTAAFEGVNATILAGGHTHTPMLRRFNQSYLINPGSVGLPWENKKESNEIRNPPWAEYAVIHIEDSYPTITFHHIRYDVRSLVDVAHQCGMPYAEWWTQDWETDEVQ